MSWPWRSQLFAHPTLAMSAVDGRHVSMVLWDWHQPEQKLSNKPFYTRLVPATPSAPIMADLRHVAPGRYRLIVRRTGFRANDPMSAYIDMGMPDSLSPAQLGKLQALTRDLPERDSIVRVGADGRLAVRLAMRSNDVVLVTLDPVK